MTEATNEGCLTPSWNVSSVRIAFANFMESAPSLLTTHASPATLPAELKKIAGSQSFRVCLQNGDYGQSYIKNGAPCLIMGAAPPAASTDGESADSRKESRGDSGRSLWSVFKQPVKIDAHSLIVFKCVWFANRVEVTGDGPVFFNECMFGAAAQRVHRGISSTESFASVHVSATNLCAFSECEFVHNCGSAADVGGSEIPVLLGSGRATLNVHNSSFLGSGVASTAMMLTDNASLEVENVSVSRCSGHSLIVSDTSSAVVFRSVFSQNSGSIWVRNQGSLEIRDSSLEAVYGGRSNLVLTEKGRCTSHGCTISATATSGFSSGRSLVVARDKAHLSLDTCELFWVNEKGLPEGRCKLPLKVPISGHDRDQLDELGLFLVMLMECSEGTFTRCLLRLPLVEEEGGWCAAVGVLLRSVPRVNTFPLYAVQNSVVYDREWGKRTPTKGKSSATADSQCMWGLVLPYTSDYRHAPDLQQLKSMWTETNHFFEGTGERLKDIAQAVTTYEVYCRATGRSPSMFHADNHENLPSFSTNSYTKEGDFSIVNHPSLENTSPPPASMAEKKPDQEEGTGNKQAQSEDHLRSSVRRTNEDGINSSSTSLTSYGDDEEENNDPSNPPTRRGSPVSVRAKPKNPSNGAASLQTEGKKHSNIVDDADVRQDTVLKEKHRQGNEMSPTANGLVSMPPIFVRAPEEPAAKGHSVSVANGQQNSDRQSGTRGSLQITNLRSLEKRESGRKGERSPNFLDGGSAPSVPRTRNNPVSKKRYKQFNGEKDISMHSDGLLLTCFTPCSASPPRRASSSVGIGELCTHKYYNNVSSASDMKPWDVRTAREMAGRGFELGKNGTYSKVSKGQAESVWDEEENFNYANGLSYASTDKDSSSVSRSRRYNATGSYNGKTYKSFTSARGGLGFHVRRVQSGHADDATARLYDEFLRKWKTTQHFSELLDELRNDQRRRERLSREAMERQAERLHSMGLQTRCERHSPQVAGSGRNYALQRRNEQRLRTNDDTTNDSTAGLCTPESVRRPAHANTTVNSEVVKRRAENGGESSCGGKSPSETVTASDKTPETKQARKGKKRGHTKRKRRKQKH
ncbi:hypothetical protein, conserved [Trypanosoma brucei brucei TREU927]|uniref:Right handed beta helix domain-containing protein n=1 Tax=Trypanosoma brucei brucei (strain 927/4 GUTat10.1) TaxID=185431 RepID=Q388V9_TRYB2|nr:hypothetical protein, conserved [Trypanosoma brucei brucei TREU927]EAN78661.1 hypothetical protein, conserved [Trypanosoma brucei brucei TREU927]